MHLKTNEVILVNQKDEWLGTMEKLKAHKEGSLHRALSVFIFNNKNQLLLQQRAAGKYHSGGLWSNSCCSHPAPGESSMAAAHRRLKEELGFDCNLQEIFTVTYHANVNNELTENEYDHIFIGSYDGSISPNVAEVQEYKFISLSDLETELNKKPGDFTPWLHIIFPKIKAYLNS